MRKRKVVRAWAVKRGGYILDTDGEGDEMLIYSSKTKAVRNCGSQFGESVVPVEIREVGR